MSPFLASQWLPNIHRHSGSKDAVITVVRDQSWVSVQIEGHGHGISAEKIKGTRADGGVGLRGMLEQFRQLGGELSVESNSSATTVEARLPVQAQTANEGRMARHPGTMK